MPSVPSFEHKKVVTLFVVLAYIGLVLVALWLIYALRNLILPLLTAIVIAMTLTPEVDRMERRGTKRGVAIGIIYLLFLAIFTLIVRGLNTVVSGQLTALVTGHIPHVLLYGQPAEVKTMVVGWMKLRHIPQMIQPPLLKQAMHMPELLDRGLIWLKTSLPAFAENLIWVIIIPVMAFFILLDFNKILGKLLLLVRPERREPILKVVTDVIAVFGNYVRGVLWVMMLDIAVIYVVLWLAGLRPYALTLAVTMGMLYTIPYFGALVSTVMIGLVTLTVTNALGSAVVVTLVMIVIHQGLFDNLIAPRLIGGSVHLHPLLTLLALMAGGTLAGIAGTLLAVPLAAAAQVIVVHLFPQFKTDVVAVRRAEAVIQATIAQDSEADKPEARKEGDEPALREEKNDARAAAQEPPPLLPPSPAVPGDRAV